MKQLRISVAMATYNGARFINEQLDSFARQTLLPSELVVCDDGSTDGTVEILHQFAAEAPFPVRVHRNRQRLGSGRNFLRAASMCSGRLVAFSDQDDVWLDQKLQVCEAAISETGSNLAIHSAEVVDEHLSLLGHRTSNVRHLTLADAGAGKGWHPLAPGACVPLGFSCVFRSTLLLDMPPVQPISVLFDADGWQEGNADKPRNLPVSSSFNGHDTWVVFAAECTGSIVLLPDVLALYRQHGHNLCGLNPRGRVTQRLSMTSSAFASECSTEAEIAVLRARLLAKAIQGSPKFRSRLTRAQRWHEERARSLALRACLYAGAGTWPPTARQLLSHIVGGAYCATSQGGLGLRALAKDIAVLLVPRPIKVRLGRLGGAFVGKA